jgi:hypothetical protein
VIGERRFLTKRRALVKINTCPLMMMGGGGGRRKEEETENAGQIR